MASFSEMGRRPEKSSFSLTCSLLSQYIKEKGCPADLGLGRPTRLLDPAVIGKPEAYRPPTTMSLLPGVDASGDDMAGEKDDVSALNSTKSVELFPLQPAKQPEKAQLTIFYGGKVLVFDNFPAEKAQDLMQLASKGSGLGVQNFSLTPPSTPADLPSCPAPSNPPASFPPRAQPSFSDLPIARKASLHRFLEKRKDRITAKAPYQLSSSEGSKSAVSVKKEEICQPWLGLGPQISNCSR
ncbi:hypothetical protein M5K25_020354 [Dendrobium thyrsiflorum]|uniref:Protein TIFY n=1 Tax=Dendrobium thyrsiflorum TaxID=117978 RepID=A0ABD0U9M2_DENTH